MKCVNVKDKVVLLGEWEKQSAPRATERCLIWKLCCAIKMKRDSLEVISLDSILSFDACASMSYSNVLWQLEPTPLTGFHDTQNNSRWMKPTGISKVIPGWGRVKILASAHRFFSLRRIVRSTYITHLHNLRRRQRREQLSWCSFPPLSVWL